MIVDNYNTIIEYNIIIIIILCCLLPYNGKFLRGFIFDIFANGQICKDHILGSNTFKYISAHSHGNGQ